MEDLLRSSVGAKVASALSFPSLGDLALAMNCKAAFSTTYLPAHVRRSQLVAANKTRSQSVANIFFWTEYEYEYIRNVLSNTNTNTNIFGFIIWTEYEYEYIRNTKVERIRIFEYF